MIEDKTNKNSPPLSGRTGGAVLLLVSGVIMAFIALFLPPPGEIHDSVLYIFAQILIYAGSIFGVSAYIDKKTHPGPPVNREGD